MNEPRKNTSNIDRAIKGYLNFRKKNNGYIGGEYISMLDAANYHKFSNPYQKLMNERGDFERLRKSILYYFHDIKLEDQMVFNIEDDDVYSGKGQVVSVVFLQRLCFNINLRSYHFP